MDSRSHKPSIWMPYGAFVFFGVNPRKNLGKFIIYLILPEKLKSIAFKFVVLSVLLKQKVFKPIRTQHAAFCFITKRFNF